MKKTFLFGAICLAAIASHAQDSSEETTEIGTTYEQCKYFAKTPPLRDLLKTLTPVDDQTFYLNQTPKPVNPMRYGDMSNVDDIGLAETGGVDPVLQDKDGTKQKQGFRINLNILGQFGAFPPDPSGAAGPDHYIQAVNSTWRIYEKDGSPETPPYSLNTLWDRSGSGDPIIMYDRFAERYFVSQFYGMPGGSDNGLLIAVSVTSDPLGEYYAYEYDYTLFPDYPKFSVWSNAYYMTANSSSADCSAFDRDKMLVGDPTAGVIKMNFPPIFQLFNSVAPAYAEGPDAPEMDEPCYFFAVQDNSYGGVTTDHIKIFKAEINWDSPGTSSVTEHQEVNTAPFNSIFAGSFSENLTQRGTDQTLDAIPGIFMYRAQYRRFPGYNVIMLSHNVNIGGNRAGMRWYELRDNDDGNWAIHQQGTYAPEVTKSRWLGNLAMDAQGNIAMAYSYTSADDYPGIRYTGRFKDDPLGEMTVPEQIGIEGDAAQTAGGRYGDYSQMSMDPTDDMTFWFTGEYIGPGGSRRTRILSFSSWHLLGTDDAAPIANPILNAYQSQPGELTISWSDLLDDKLTLNVVDLRGRHIYTEDFNGNNSTEQVTLPETANGIFIVSLTGEQTNLTRKIYIGR